MIIESKVKRDIRFRVQAFWHEEGGMGEDEFPNGGKPVATIEEALHRFVIAKEMFPDTDWVIVGTVEVTK